MFARRLDFMPLDSRWFDITVWGGVLVVTAYAMGTLYERNQKSLKELKDGYDGMLVILQHFSVTKEAKRFVPGFFLRHQDCRGARGWIRQVPKTFAPPPCCVM